MHCCTFTLCISIYTHTHTRTHFTCGALLTQHIYSQQRVIANMQAPPRCYKYAHGHREIGSRPSNTAMSALCVHVVWLIVCWYFQLVILGSPVVCNIVVVVLMIRIQSTARNICSRYIDARSRISDGRFGRAITNLWVCITASVLYCGDKRAIWRLIQW